MRNVPRPPTRKFDLILDDDEENSIIIKINSTDQVWDHLQETADGLVLDLYRHCTFCPSLSRRTRVFLASVALLREVVSAEWVSDAIEAVQDFKAKKPPAYLHTCLQKGMAGHLPGGSPDSCEELLGRVRTVVSRWVSKHEWRPDVVVARERAEQNKPKQREPSEKGWFELSDAEREAIAREHASVGGMRGLLKAHQQKVGAER